jgi:hypothetical protein
MDGAARAALSAVAVTTAAAAALAAVPTPVVAAGSKGVLVSIRPRRPDRAPGEPVSAMRAYRSDDWRGVVSRSSR